MLGVCQWLSSEYDSRGRVRRTYDAIFLSYLEIIGEMLQFVLVGFASAFPGEVGNIEAFFSEVL